MDRIKESFDILPIAVCFFDKNGGVRLINHRMLSIVNILRKDGIQTLSELRHALEFPPSNIYCLDPKLQIFLFPDNQALQFTEESITTKAGIPYTQIIAADVTELINKQNLLKEENSKLKEANDRLRTLFTRMPEIIREEETLAMKLRVHDGIGHSILAARRALINNASARELKVSAELWEQSIAILYRYNQMTVHNELLETAQKRAEEMGVKVITEGAFPKTKKNRRLTSLAICECAANCVRHAGGTELYVCFDSIPGYVNVSISNNGAKPKEEIIEGGGLSMLRHRIEGSGGIMRIQSFPNFNLKLDLPEKEETVNESDDR